MWPVDHDLVLSRLLLQLCELQALRRIGFHTKKPQLTHLTLKVLIIHRSCWKIINCDSFLIYIDRVHLTCCLWLHRYCFRYYKARRRNTYKPHFLMYCRKPSLWKIYSALWNLLRGNSRNKHIFTLSHIREKGMHKKLKSITKFILICISIRDESVKAELKERDRQSEFTQKALFVETPSPVWGENEALECAPA